MRKTNKKKIILSIILVFAVLIELLALRFSRAEGIIEVNLNVTDHSQILAGKTIQINATDSGESGYYITLPEMIDNIKVTKYYVEEKTITENEDGTTDSVSNVVEKNVGDNIYLTEEEITNLEITITAEYDTKEENDITLYYTKITEVIDEENNSITVEGYMPLETSLMLGEITEEENTEIQTALNNENLLQEFSLKKIFDLSLINNEEEYEETGADIYDVIIASIDTTREYQVFQVNRENAEGIILEEVENVVIEGSTICLEVNNFNQIILLESNSQIVEESQILAATQLMSEAVTYAVSNTATLSIEEGIPVWTGSVATGFEIGEGTQNFPYLISNGEELAYLASQVNSGTTYEGVYFQLASDIDLDNREWTPIGTYEDSFMGIFDGAGHTIANAEITISSLATSIESYGIFGSIGGGTSDTEIRNVEFHNINIIISASGTTSRWISEGGYNIGFVTGTMYKNSTVKNVIVKGSTVTDTYTISLRNNSYQVLVGGIAGEARNSSTTTTDPGDGSRYLIENCYVSSDFTLDIALRNNTLANAGQYNVGGIIGRIRSQAVWPTNCLYSGTITCTNAFIGPIFGALVNNTSIDSTNNYATLWNGNDAGNLTMTSYYTNFTANGTSFTANQESGTSTSRISNQARNIGYVQGVNKGLYVADKSSRLDAFNSLAGGNYVLWEYGNEDLSLIPRFSGYPVEISANRYKIIIQDPYETGNYTYKWYVNGELDETITGDTGYEFTPTFDTGYDVKVLMYDGTYYAVTEFEVPKLYIDIEFDINENTDSVQANLVGTALPYVSMSDYTFTWYSMDISGTETLVQTGDSLTLENLENGMEYKLVATNSVEPRASSENSFVYGDRIVIFVDYNDGNNSNDGYTPETAVQNLATAYGKLSAEGTRNENIIVMMGNYTDTYISYFNQLEGSTNTTYAKKATITGKYGGVDYETVWRFGSTRNTYYFRYLSEDLTIMNLTLNGGNGYMYLICQGHSFTVGENVTMTNYTNASTNQGLLGNNAPGFHLFAGWYQYDLTELPANNSEIVIKSGTFGRIVLGGTPGTSAGQGQENSLDFIGSEDEYFNVSFTMDIKNSTTANEYDYDVNLLVGGSACGNNYSIVTENIMSGTVGRVCGGSIGDSATRPTLGWNGEWTYPENTFLGETTINISGGTVEELYGGCLGRNMNVVGSTTATGNTCDSYFYGDIIINITGGTVTGNIYGAGAGGVTGYHENSSDPYKSYGESFDTNVNINISNGTIEGDIYGGGYGYTEYLNANVTAVDGGALYGNSNIKISGSPIINGNIFAAGCGYDLSSKPDIAQMIGDSSITIEGTPTIIGSIFGAGAGLTGYENMAKLTGTSTINIKADLSTPVYGGGNIAQTIGTTNINIESGNHTGDIYGGGNVGILEGTANVTINGGTQNRVFGGGNEATATTTNVYIKGGTTEEVYGGGNLASVTTTNVFLQGGTVENIYAGSNQSGDVQTANLNATSGNATNIYGGNNQGGEVTNSYVTVDGANITNAYGGNNAGGTTTTTEVRVNSGIVENIFGGGNEAETTETNVYIEGGTVTNAFGGGNLADVTTTNVNIKGGTITNAYGGGNLASATTTNVYIEGGISSNVFAGSNQSGNIETANLVSNGGTASNVYGGNNQGGNVTNSYIIIQEGNITNVYGGNNEGGTTSVPNINIKGGTIGNIFGGGNRAEVPVTCVIVEAGTIGNIFGGGNAAGVDTNTIVTITGGTIEGNVYGGGNEGVVEGNTEVQIKNATVKGSAYAGGNGATAVVYSNAKITIEGNTIIGTVDDEVSPHKGSVFGGGNAAATGLESTNNSTSTVNIVGGEIYGNVYGGANTSVVYGYTYLNIGYDTVQDDTLTKSDIYIRGTIFGGGEANAEGSEVYDFNFISVTEGIEIQIDGNGYDSFKTEGSIYGSGNASSTSGESNITIKNYGTVDEPNKNISIQRANLVTIENSAILLLGERDSANEIVYFLEYSLIRLDHLKIKNNTTLYLNRGANLLKKVSSLVDVDGEEVLSTVIIDEETGTTEKNVDNRIYMKEGQTLNVLLTEDLDIYGEIDGMTFLGIYTNNNNPSESTGLYNYQYSNGDEITNAGTFVNNGSVSAKHETEHDIYVDGFYTNYDDEGYIKTWYVGVTPEDDIYYLWQVGEEVEVTTLTLELSASKFATLGTKERVLTGFAKPNTVYQVIGFTPDLEEGISLVSDDEIEPIALEEGVADSVFGLSMKTAKKGWLTDGRTDFYTENAGGFDGTTQYKAENLAKAPSLVFSLYHSQNISEAKFLGTVTVRLQAVTPNDETLTYDVAYIDIVITLSTGLIQDDYYETAITPGEEFELFNSTETIITEESIFSTYYSLIIQNFSESDYYENFTSYNRALVSRDENLQPYIYKENTKLVMLDMATNNYYYYVVTAEDEASGKYIYYFKDFIEMGSTNSYYEEANSLGWYYYEDQDLIYENFICHIDVSESGITESAINNTLYIELQDEETNTLIGIYEPLRDSTRYSIYTGQSATIDVTASSQDVIYLGETINLDVTTDFKQNVTSDDVTIFDTKYMNSKMGIKISIFDNNGNQLNSDSLLGMNFEYDGEIYYPRIDGTVRIKIADRISNVLSKIKISTEDNKTLATGTYTIKVESFGSPDGIYYGLDVSDYAEKTLTIINSEYGLKVSTDEQTKIVDKTTGKTLHGNNAFIINIDYESRLENPIVTVTLLRRDYTTEYSYVYNEVDLKEYIINVLYPTTKEFEYTAIEEPADSNQMFYNFKENLVTGTYKIVFKLYDGTTYIGEAYDYVIIK